MLLSAQIEERRRIIQEDLSAGTAKDFGGYQHACGEVRGYLMVQSFISELLRTNKEQEEDFESNINQSECHYGEYFIASYEQNNIVGTQFHPELSQINGLKLLKNLADKKKKTIIFSTHEIDLAIQVSHKMIVMTKDKTYFDKPEMLIKLGCFENLFPSETIEFDNELKQFILKK